MMSFTFRGESEGIEVEVAFQYTEEFHENMMGFCNNIYNSKVEHISQDLRRRLRRL